MPEAFRTIASFVVGLAAFCIAFYSIKWSKPGPIVDELTLDTIIADIKRELQQLEDTPGPKLGLNLSEVKISLHVQESTQSNRSLSLTVPVFDEDSLVATQASTVQSGSKVIVVLAPPEGSEILSGTDDSSVVFADLLESTRRSLHDAMESEPRLAAKEIHVELVFVLTKKRSGSGSVNAKIVSAGVSASHEDSTSNKITLKYVNPNYQSDTGKGASILPP